MKIILLICFISIGIYIWKYDEMSYRRYYERCEINAKHPDWKPWCGRNFFEEDPKWFVDNGYEDIVMKYYKKPFFKEELPK